MSPHTCSPSDPEPDWEDDPEDWWPDLDGSGSPYLTGLRTCSMFARASGVGSSRTRTVDPGLTPGCLALHAN